MYRCDQRKLGFFMPPRTGSTTLSQFLLQWGATRFDGGKHLKPHQVPLENLTEYKTYGFYREPLARFLSLLRHMQQTYSRQENIVAALSMTPEQIQALTYDQLVDLFPLYEKISTFYYSPQIEWLADCEVFDYSQYHQGVLQIARMFDVKEVFICRNNASKNTGETPSQKVIDFVQSYYADDYRFGRERGLIK